MNESQIASQIPIDDQIHYVLDLVLSAPGPVTVTEILIHACNRKCFAGASKLGLFLPEIVREHNLALSFSVGGVEK